MAEPTRREHGETALVCMDVYLVADLLSVWLIICDCGRWAGFKWYTVWLRVVVYGGRRACAKIFPNHQAGRQAGRHASTMTHSIDTYVLTRLKLLYVFDSRMLNPNHVEGTGVVYWLTIFVLFV